MARARGLEPQHGQISHRLTEHDPLWQSEPRARDGGTGARVHGQHHGPGRAGQAGQDGLELLRVVRVLRAVHCGQDEVARHPEAGEQWAGLGLGAWGIGPGPRPA